LTLQNNLNSLEGMKKVQLSFKWLGSTVLDIHTYVCDCDAGTAKVYNLLITYRAFHIFGQLKFPDGGSVLGLSQISKLPKAVSKNDARFKSGQN